MTLPADLATRIRAAVDHDGSPQAAMLEALRLIQHAEGWVSDERLAEAAEVLGVGVAELENLATFYSLIFRRPVGETVILLCDGAPCWLNGGDAVRDALFARLGIGFGQTTADGRYTVINMACVGGCDRAPAAVVGRDRRLVGPLSPDGLAALLEGGL
ncbi:NADH-quinone oxidoreductase subunit NuoE [Paracoccaceae bacterium Fryx2]|nr:NADH-quinone oxidoreductase subunit NuoE [Paracoccaceae bacterium Fryx2]